MIFNSSINFIYEVTTMLDHRINTFLQLYQLMNYRKTAEVLLMTQPGVTQHIHHLEQHYGVKLFHYDGRRLHRTAEAEALKRHIDRILAAEHALRKELSHPQGIHLDVGATKTIGEYVLTPALQHFLAQPQHSVNFVIDNTEVLLRQLEDSQLDFAVIEGIFDKTRYGFHLFKQEDYVGICAKDHPFAGKSVRLADAFTQTLVVREMGSGTRRLLEEAVRDKGYALSCFRRCVSVSNFSVIAELVASGKAITFGYAPVAAHRNDLSTFTVEDMHITGEFNFVYCDEESARKAITQFFAP